MNIKFNYVGCATWILEIDNIVKISCDPAFAQAGTKYVYKGLKTTRLRDGVVSNDTFDNTDIWLISHPHFDHLNDKGLEYIKNSSKIVSNKNCKKLLSAKDNLSVDYLRHNQSINYDIKGYKINITAVLAEHGKNFFGRFLMGDVNGYMIKITDPNNNVKTVYATSDTVLNKRIKKSIRPFNVDLLIANMGNIKADMPGGPFTMNNEMFLELQNITKPTITYPIHLDDFSHFSSTYEEMEKLKSDYEFILLRNGESDFKEI